MRKILLTLFVLTLSACTLLDAALMTKYDAVEYKIITDIRAESFHAKSQCADPVTSKTNADRIAYQAALFEFYSEFIPHNTDMIRASKELNAIALGLRDRYKGDAVSATFCKIKFESIENSAMVIQKSIGAKPR